MIVCSCNVLTDREIREAVRRARHVPRMPKDIYALVGVEPGCRSCAGELMKIARDALASVPLSQDDSHHVPTDKTMAKGD